MTMQRECNARRCMYVYIYIYICIETCMHICICTYICVYIYIYIYMSLSRSLFSIGKDRYIEKHAIRHLGGNLMLLGAQVWALRAKAYSRIPKP